MDKLEEIKAEVAWYNEHKDKVADADSSLASRAVDYIPWLVGEVEHRRDLLARLEWAGTYCERDREMAACPICDVVADSEVIGQRPHAPDCWLAKELGR